MECLLKLCSQGPRFISAPVVALRDAASINGALKQSRAATRLDFFALVRTFEAAEGRKAVRSTSCSAASGMFALARHCNWGSMHSLPVLNGLRDGACLHRRRHSRHAAAGSQTQPARIAAHAGRTSKNTLARKDRACRPQSSERSSLRTQRSRSLHVNIQTDALRSKPARASMQSTLRLSVLGQ